MEHPSNAGTQFGHMLGSHRRSQLCSAEDLIKPATKRYHAQILVYSQELTWSPDQGIVRFFSQVQSRLLLSCPPKLIKAETRKKSERERERENQITKNACIICTSHATPKPVFALFQEQTISLARSPKWLDWHGLWLSSAPISRFCGRSSARQVHSVADTVIWSLLIGLPNRCYKTQRQATLWSAKAQTVDKCWRGLEEQRATPIARAKAALLRALATPWPRRGITVLVVCHGASHDYVTEALDLLSAGSGRDWQGARQGIERWYDSRTDNLYKFMDLEWFGHMGFSLKQTDEKNIEQLLSKDIERLCQWPLTFWSSFWYCGRAASHWLPWLPELFAAQALAPGSVRLDRQVPFCVDHVAITTLLRQPDGLWLNMTQRAC